MKKIVVYWSGSGNTESIANKIAADLGCEAYSVSAIDAAEVASNDLIVFGCPAMGSEELEDSEFRPFYESVMSQAADKKIALFGSYGWGDGEWMRNWEAEVGANLVGPGLIVNGGDSDIIDDEYANFINLIK